MKFYRECDEIEVEKLQDRQLEEHGSDDECVQGLLKKTLNIHLKNPLADWKRHIIKKEVVAVFNNVSDTKHIEPFTENCDWIKQGSMFFFNTGDNIWLNLKIQLLLTYGCLPRPPESSALFFGLQPLDIHKKLPILKSFKDFKDDDTPTSTTRNSQLLRIASVEVENKMQPVPSKKLVLESPTPQFVVVDTYERDYSASFGQPASYLRARGARSELGEFVEYDLDNEDEDGLYEFDKDNKKLPPEKLESIIFKLDVLDHKMRERAGVIAPTLGSPVPVLLQLDGAIDVL